MRGIIKMINTGIKLDEEDRRDLHYIIHLMDTACAVLNNYEDIEVLTEEQYKEYLKASMECLFESRLGMYNLRKKFSKKYNIPFNLISDNGDIYVKEESDGN